MTGRINLDRCLFAENQKTLCQVNGLNAMSFLFTTGVHALHLENPGGHIVVLPWHGRQGCSVTRPADHGLVSFAARGTLLVEASDG